MTRGATGPPLVTIGIPLYRARSFVDRIVANVAAIDYPELEFVIADQHGLDDALPVLRERLRADPRVLFFDTRDELDWIGNYNFVLRKAAGKYFRLLAQDDLIPPASIAAAVAAMEADSEVVVVDGPVDIIDADGRVVRQDSARPRRARSRRWGPRLDSLALLAGWSHEGANLGLVRRAVAIDDDLLIPHTSGLTGLSVRAWLFALSLRGRLQTVPEYRNLRCIHPHSFTAKQRGRSVGQEIDRLASYLGVALRSWAEARMSTAERFWTLPALLIAGIVMLPARRAWQRCRLRARAAGPAAG